MAEEEFSNAVVAEDDDAARAAAEPSAEDRIGKAGDTAAGGFDYGGLSNDVAAASDEVPEFSNKAASSLEEPASSEAAASSPPPPPMGTMVLPSADAAPPAPPTGTAGVDEIFQQVDSVLASKPADEPAADDSAQVSTAVAEAAIAEPDAAVAQELPSGASATVYSSAAVEEPPTEEAPIEEKPQEVPSGASATVYHSSTAEEPPQAASAPELPSGASATVYHSSAVEEPAALTDTQPQAGGATASDDAPAGEKKWAVDTSYIDRRTKDVSNLEARKSVIDESAGGKLPGAVLLQAAGSKTADGKWQTVDTEYIDRRTKDVSNLEARKNVDEAAGGKLPGALIPQAAGSKTADGKWQQVDTGYIDHRTADPNLRDVRRSIDMPASAAVGTHSATVKKEGEGKWKVDVSYIQTRTGDTERLERTFEKKDTPTYADPTTTKVAYEDLKEKRAADIDPTQREAYLSDAEFQIVFGMDAAAFSKLPKWKKQNMKKDKGLF